MRSTLSFLSLVFLASITARAAETLIPAGSLIECTVSEHNFSSKTAELGDPVLCQAGLIEGAWGSSLPYGTFLTGRFSEYKDPGHFVGKGWMELKFDRMVLPPDRVVPVSAKVVYAPGLLVDKYGRIHGAGHPVRDIVEWSIPVLWPIDVLALPRRGPRPRLKDETRLRLKIMDDMAVPAADPTPRTMLPRSSVSPAPYSSTPSPVPTMTPSAFHPQAPAAPLGDPLPLNNEQLTVLMLSDGNGRLASNYWFEGSRQVRYIALNGNTVVIPIERLDLAATADINRRRGVPFIVRSAQTY